MRRPPFDARPALAFKYCAGDVEAMLVPIKSGARPPPKAALFITFVF